MNMTEKENISRPISDDASDDRGSYYARQFGRLIRNRRHQLHMTEETLAERCNRSDRAIRNIEAGTAEPKLSTVIQLCAVCHIDMGELGRLLGATAPERSEIGAPL